MTYLSASTPTWAQRLEDIQPFHVMRLLADAQALAAQGRDIIHLEVGEPDFPTPAPIIAAGQAALAAGQTRYTPAAGLPALRQAISDDYARRFQVEVAPERIFVTPGASGALLLASALTVNPGMQVMMADPTYPCNRNFMALMGGQAQLIPVDASTDFQLSAKHVEQHWQANTGMLMLASPANPTGTLVTPQHLAAISQAVRARGGHLLVDEIYQGLTYGVPDHTALATDADALVINSFSKYFGMTGWRLGWLVVPEGAQAAVEKLAQNIFLAPSTPAQYAALAAFTAETQAILQQRRQILAERRDYLVPALRALGMQVPVMPQGAFYVYAGIDHLTEDAMAWCQSLLNTQGVAVTPGLDFGVQGARQSIRLAYTCDLPRLEEAVQRIRAFIA